MPFQLALAALLTVSLTITVADCRVYSRLLFSPTGVSGTVRSQAGNKALSADLLRLTDAYRTAKSKAPSPSAKRGGSRKALPWTKLMQAAADGDTKAVRRALAAGANPNALSSNGWTPLMWAADGGHAGAVSILIDHGAVIDLADKKGTTALMLAAMRKQHGAIDVLLKRGASANEADKSGVTPLMIAASMGDTETVRKLLALAAKVDARDVVGKTALMRAANVPIVELLIEKGADVLAQSNSGMTPLMAAAKRQNFNVIIALMQHGADIRTKDKKGKTAREWGSYYNYGSVDDHHVILEILSYHPDKVTLCKAAILGREDVAADLIRKGLSRDDMEKCEASEPDFGHSTPLWWAVRTGRLSLVKLLLDKGASASKDGAGLVWDAAYRGRADILKVLLEHGALRHTNRPAGYWQDVCKQGRKHILQLLDQYDPKLCGQYARQPWPKGCLKTIMRHADRWARNYDPEKGVTPQMIRFAASHKDTPMLKCLLETAAKQGLLAAHLQGAMEMAVVADQAVNIALLHKYGVDINQADSRGYTPLMWASMDGRLKAARKLIEYGADVHARSKDGLTALMYAQAHGYDEIVKLLKSHGARNDANLAGTAASGDVRAAEKLLRSGAHINASDSLGWTPLLWACATGQAKMVRFLLKHGAQLNARARILYSHPRKKGGYVGQFGPLEVAAYNGHADVVRVLIKHLKKSVASLDEQSRFLSDTGDEQVRQAFHIALQQGHTSVLRALEDYGARVDLASSASGARGNRALAAAAKAGHRDLVKFLLQHGADVNATPSADDVQGSAALLAAVRAGHPDLVELLLKRGANPNSFEVAQGDSYYEPTALELATSKGHERIRQLLLRFGANYSKFP